MLHRSNHIIWVSILWSAEIFLADFRQTLYLGYENSSFHFLCSSKILALMCFAFVFPFWSTSGEWCPKIFSPTFFGHSAFFESGSEFGTVDICCTKFWRKTFLIILFFLNDKPFFFWFDLSNFGNFGVVNCLSEARALAQQKKTIQQIFWKTSMSIKKKLRSI